MEEKFTHFDQHGNAIMVDISEKKVTFREATASGKIKVSKEIIEAIKKGTSKKGDVLGVARVAGIMGVKKTFELIPMCHTILIQKCAIDFEVLEEKLEIVAFCTLKTEGKTGVEMEALTGVSIALLTIYDMCKAIDKRMEIGEIRLEEKKAERVDIF